MKGGGGTRRSGCFRTLEEKNNKTHTCAAHNSPTLVPLSVSCTCSPLYIDTHAVWSPVRQGGALECGSSLGKSDSVLYLSCGSQSDEEEGWRLEKFWALWISGQEQRERRRALIPRDGQR